LVSTLVQVVDEKSKKATMSHSTACVLLSQLLHLVKLTPG